MILIPSKSVEGSRKVAHLKFLMRMIDWELCLFLLDLIEKFQVEEEKCVMMVCLMMSSSSKTNLCPSSNWRNCRICLPRQARDRPRTGPGGWLICTRTPSLDRGWYYCVDHNDFTSYTHGRNPTEDSSYLNFPSSIPEEVCATSLRNATSIFTC